jgi:hypothetical protein
MSARLRRRLIYAAAALAIIALGLLTRLPIVSLPHVFAKYAGSILWGAMVYVVLRVVVPERELKDVALAAGVISAAVEFSQLIHWPWLDAVRSTTIGALLIGRAFSWWDIVSYWIGIALAVLGDGLCGARRASPPASSSSASRRSG